MVRGFIIIPSVPSAWWRRCWLRPPCPLRTCPDFPCPHCDDWGRLCPPSQLEISASWRHWTNSSVLSETLARRLSKVWMTFYKMHWYFSPLCRKSSQKMQKANRSNHNLFSFNMVNWKHYTMLKYLCLTLWHYETVTRVTLWQWQWHYNTMTLWHWNTMTVAVTLWYYDTDLYYAPIPDLITPT